MDFSSKLRAFINRSIASVEHVEVLLLLHADEDRTWTADEIAGELRRSTASVEGRLRDLARSRVAEIRDGRWKYRRDSQDEAVEELRREYESRRVRLIEAIFTRSIDSARTFADAFRLWDDEDDR